MRATTQSCSALSWHCTRAAVLAVGITVLFACASVATAWAAEGGDGPPEIHEVTWASEPNPRLLELRGAALHGKRGKLRIGGVRARVRSWDDTTVLVKVPGRLGGGVHALELTTRDKRELEQPVPVAVPGRVRPATSMSLRYGGRRTRHGVSSPPVVVNDTLSASFMHTKKTVRTKMKAKRTRVCSWRKVCVIDFGPFGCATSRRRVCSWKVTMVPTRQVKKRHWTVALELPVGSEDLSTPLLITSQDMPPGASSPITYQGPKGTLFEIDPERDDWWVVIGRDQDGTVCGQFCAVTAAGKKVTGHFAGGP